MATPEKTTPNGKPSRPAARKLSGTVAVAGTTPAKTLPKPATKAKYQGSIFTFPDKPLPEEFVEDIWALEKALGLPVWLIVQGHGKTPFGALDMPVLEMFIHEKANLPADGVAILLDSPGGNADIAYQLAMLLRRRCTSFVSVVPRWAKSAATLFSLGADKIYLGEDGQLGPLDAQIRDPDNEESWGSALDEVNAVAALEEATADAAAGTLFSLQSKTQKKLSSLMPAVFDFVAKLHEPLFQKIDTVKYSQKTRILDVAEQYALRLLQPKYGELDAKHIARQLVKHYPSHGFVINREEAARIGKRAGRQALGLQVAKTDEGVDRLLDRFYSQVGDLTVIGRLQEREEGAGK